MIVTVHSYTLRQGFPAMFQENLMVVKELLQNGRYYNVDTDNVFIMGKFNFTYYGKRHSVYKHNTIKWLWPSCCLLV